MMIRLQALKLALHPAALVTCMQHQLLAGNGVSASKTPGLRQFALLAYTAEAAAALHALPLLHADIFSRAAYLLTMLAG